MMNVSGRKLWIRAVILVGVVYSVVGVVFALPSSHVRGWRLAAWVVSAVVAAAHISYEHFRLNNSARATALHASMAVALGAFLLAVAATVHASMASSHAPYWRVPFSPPLLAGGSPPPPAFFAAPVGAGVCPPFH